MKIGLFIIFNHCYPENIEKLERIYRNRFKNIYYCLPFYTSNDNNIITVWESSLYFQNYVPYIYQRVMNEGFDYFFFVADDLLLNPEINEENLFDRLSISTDEGCISEFQALSECYYWPLRMIFQAKECFDTPYQGVNMYDVIDRPDKAFEVAKRNGYQRAIYDIKKWENRKIFDENKEFSKRYADYYSKLKKGRFSIDYPLVGGFADIFGIPAKNMEKMARLCGGFGALNLHVEIALPTAFLLSCESFSFFNSNNVSHGNSEEIENRYNCSLDMLVHNSMVDSVYYHPVKLSHFK